jgi:hypothetical protein
MAYHNNPRIVTDGLVLCLDAADKKSYPGSGTTWYDRSGNGNNFTLSGPDYVSSNPSHFSFLDNQVDQIYNSSFSFGGLITTMTANCWVRFDNINGNSSVISYAENGQSANQYLIYYGGGITPKRLEFWFDNTFVVVNYTLTSSVWYNIVNVVSSTNSILYLNGQEIQSNSRSGTQLEGSGYMIFGQEQDSFGGAFDAGQDLLGDIAQVSIYNRALTADEILQNYNAVKGRFGL